MYFIIFVGQLQPSCIIVRYYISCRVQDTIVYNLRHKLDYLCKYVIKLDIRSKQKWIEKKTLLHQNIFGNKKQYGWLFQE